MKINYKNTALGLIDDPDNFNFGFPDPDITPHFTSDELKEFANSIIDNSKHLKDMCGDNIEYVSHSFMEAFTKSLPKLKPLFYEEQLNDGGIIITGGTTNGYTHYHTYYYAVVSVLGDDNKVSAYQVIFMDFSKHSKADIPALDVYVTVQATPGIDELITKSVIWNGYANNKRDATYWQIFIIAFCLFKKYCDIETKVIDPKKSRKAVVAGQKYLNETDKRIKVLDATWFTNLVISGEFGVSGHLRWQRFGPDLSEKKLIWIDDFTKHGYTRKAKAIQQNNSQHE